MAKSKKIGVLWLKQGQDGKSRFFTGYINGGILGDIQIAIFKNTYKKKDGDPDFNIILSEPKPTNGEAKSEYDDDSDVPF